MDHPAPAHAGAAPVRPALTGQPACNSVGGMLLFLVDAFTDAPFKGNPAAVCIMDGPKPDGWMMRLAAEMNLSETAFLEPRADGYGLRWFTPKTEVTLCGHATLASAHVLWEEKREPAGKTILFHTASGELAAARNGSLIEMDFPARIAKPAEENAEVNASLGVSPVFTGKYETARGDIYLIGVDSDGTVRGLKPDFPRLLSTKARSVIVTAASSDGRYDFVSRYFAPAVGINEDPVTGSSHCCLAPYWSGVLGKRELTGFQASGRSGTVRCAYNGDRVLIGGNAVTVFRAELFA